MRTAPALLIVLAATLALVGCVPDDDPIVLDPDPSVSPIFESDEEALAAAEAAYAEYSSVSSNILMEGGQNPDRIEPFVSPDILQNQLDGFSLYSDAGWHISGPSTFDSFVLQQHLEESDVATVVVYLCVDVSSARVLDASGTDVTPIGREDRVPLEVEVAFANSDSWLISRTERWGGDDFCV